MNIWRDASLHSWKQQGLQVLTFGNFEASACMNLQSHTAMPKKERRVYLSQGHAKNVRRPIALRETTWSARSAVEHSSSLQPCYYNHREMPHKPPVNCSFGLYLQLKKVASTKRFLICLRERERERERERFWHLPNASRIWSGWDHQDKEEAQEAQDHMRSSSLLYI